MSFTKEDFVRAFNSWYLKEERIYTANDAALWGFLLGLDTVAKLFDERAEQARKEMARHTTAQGISLMEGNVLFFENYAKQIRSIAKSFEGGE